MKASEVLELVRAGYSKDEIEAMGQEAAPPAADPVPPQEAAPPAADPVPPQESVPPAAGNVPTPEAASPADTTMRQLLDSINMLREAIYGRNMAGDGRTPPVYADPTDEWVERFNNPPEKKGE